MRMAIRCATNSDVWREVEAAREKHLSAAGFAAVLSDSSPPAGIIQVERYEELWQAVLAECGRLVPGRCKGYRSRGLFSADGAGCSVILSRENRDGTATVWHIEAHTQPFRNVISVQVHGPWTDSRDEHWERLLAEGGRHVVAGHAWYSFGTTNSPRAMKGFGGRVFRFRYPDGTEVTHDDMWFAGTIPPAWRERIPDTAEMIEGRPPEFTGPGSAADLLEQAEEQL